MPTVILANPVDEGKSSNLLVTHYDKDGALVVPASIRYRIDDPDSLRAVKAWTVVSPASSYSILITATENSMVTTKPKERRKVTVHPVIDVATDQADPSDCVYEISKLQFYP